MTEINAEIVADSLSPQGHRLTSFLVTFPRIILSEMLTHRMFERNTSSSRAIPYNTMHQTVKRDPFIPTAWQTQHSGMQGNKYIPTIEEHIPRSSWVKARDYALVMANNLHNALGITKQLANRLLEPWMWVTMLITTGEEGLQNFFNLRCPRYVNDHGHRDYKSKKELIDRNPQLSWAKLKTWQPVDWLQINAGMAEIHIMELAEHMYDAYNASQPIQLQAYEWHTPFKDKIDEAPYVIMNFAEDTPHFVKLSTAMAARTSYTVVGNEKELNWAKLYELHDKLITQDPLHASPMGHCARAMDDDEYNANGKLIDGHMEHGWCRNFRGFKQYRYLLETKQI